MKTELHLENINIHGVHEEKLVSVKSALERVISRNLIIPPHSSVEVFRTDTPIIPESRKFLRLNNEGRASVVTATFYWSHTFTNQWFADVSMDVKRGEEGTLKCPPNAFYYSKYVIYNNTDETASVTASLA
ncbi:MAG: hypothetical protein G5700_04175 [Serratia symbiotica]|nr:hypothetical protein [Serratia symbiotica]